MPKRPINYRLRPRLIDEHDTERQRAWKSQSKRDLRNTILVIAGSVAFSAIVIATVLYFAAAF